MATFNINLHEAIYSLSHALDLVGVTHIHHGKRVAYMAAECGKQMGWSGRRMSDLFEAAILHDCGVSKTSVHSRLAQFEWEQEQDHCNIGAVLLNSSPVLEHIAPVIRYHHTHWSELKDMDLPAEVKLAANCIYLVDRVDVLSLSFQSDHSNLLLGQEHIRNKIAEKRGDWFCPELVDAFMQISCAEAFWLSLEEECVLWNLSAWLSDSMVSEVAFDELRSVMRIFSHIVDAKSSFTKSHSDGVARLARYLGEDFKLPEESCEMLELAGLLHDIGKLRQPDELLDKPGRLTKEEFSSIQRHSFDTYNILKNIKGLERVTQWATLHHERVDGSGYPYHLNSEALPLEARILAVADVFQALAQARPYRDALQPDEIIEILNEMVDDGKLDRLVVMHVDHDLQMCWKMALGKEVARIS